MNEGNAGGPLAQVVRMHGGEILTNELSNVTNAYNESNDAIGKLFSWALRVRSLTLLSEGLTAKSRKRPNRFSDCSCDDTPAPGTRRLPILIAAHPTVPGQLRQPFPVAYISWVEGYGAISRVEIVEVPLPFAELQEMRQHGLAGFFPQDEWDWAIAAPVSGSLIPWMHLRKVAIANVATMVPEALVMRFSLCSTKTETENLSNDLGGGIEFHGRRSIFVPGQNGFQPLQLLTFAFSPKSATRWPAGCPISIADATLGF